jgi:catechol 2,3-dioxygenase-like lactoylglutathione lyase family enzyme
MSTGPRARVWYDRLVLHSLDHVIVGVRDLDAATKTYTALLGRPPSWRGTHPGMGTANTLFRLENTYLELLGPSGEGGTAAMLRARLDSDGEGLIGMAFGTDDADACARELRARGLSPSDPIPGTGRDPERPHERAWKNVILPQAESRGPLVFAIEHLSAPDALPMAEPLAAKDSIVTGLDHIVVNTQDVEATKGFYGEKLGLRLALDRTFEKRGVRLLFFRVGGVTVEVATRLAAPVDSSARDRLWGLAWRVPDADAARARLAAAGFDPTPTRDGHKAGTRVCTVESGTQGVPTLLIEAG